MRFVPLMFLMACSENEMAKSFGGTMHLDLPCGEKLTEITWKDTDLWYAYRPMREGEVPETTTFKADTAMGVMEGTVIVQECR